MNNTGNDGTVNVEIPVPLKYLSNFWRTLEILLINCKITRDLIWSENSVICKQTKQTLIAIIDAKLSVPVATLSTQDNVKPLQQLKVYFKKTISWNKYLSKIKTFAQN